MRITLELSSPVLEDSEVFAKAARLAIESAILVNVSHLRAFPKTPNLYDSGVRYRLEPPGVEDFTDIATTIRRGWGDCAQLVAWRVAELIVRRREPATVRITWVRDPRTRKRMFHVQVRRSNGRVEDPSVRLGMNSGEAVPVEKLPLVGYKNKGW